MIQYNKCSLCGDNETGDTTHEGDIVVGGYGSTQFDGCCLIWLKAPPDSLQKGEYICDDCVARLIEEGSLEAYLSFMDADVGRVQTEAAYKALFLMGAKEMFEEVASVRGGNLKSTYTTDADSIFEIERLRATIHKDPTEGYGSRKAYSLVAKENLGKASINVGKAHVAAALLLGYEAGHGPELELASDVFAERMSEQDRHRSELLQLFAAP